MGPAAKSYAWLAVAVVAAMPVCRLSAQDTTLHPRPPRTLQVAPGREFAAGTWHRILFGSLWRDAWTSAVECREADFAREGGGLSEVSPAADSTSVALVLRGRDGRLYQFRTLRKHPSEVFPRDVLDGIASDLLEDFVAGTYPYADAMADVLREAIGMPACHPRLVALPEDRSDMQVPPEWRSRPGLIVCVPLSDDSILTDTRTVLGLTSASLGERIDACEVLKIRLLDFFMGSWCDRSASWRWVPDGIPGMRTWRPVAFDSPLAFCRFTGVAQFAAGLVIAPMPACTEEYPPARDLAWDGRAFDRVVLSSLSRHHFDSLAAFVTARITDQVIDSVIAAIPLPRRDEDGPVFRSILQRRRIGLPDFARHYYAMLARTVEIHAPSVPIRAEVRRNSAGGADLGIYARMEKSTASAPHASFFRSFDPEETDEVRLFLGGNNSECDRGDGGEIRQTVRVIAGVTGTAKRGTIDLLAEKMTQEVAPLPDDGVLVKKPRMTEDRGSSLDLGVMLDYNSEFGPIAGVGPVYYRYGFGYSPYAWSVSAIGGYAPFGGSGRLRLSLDTRALIPGTAITMNALLSGYEMLSFFGIGNEAAMEPGRSREYYYPHLRQYRLLSAWNIPVSSAWQFSMTASANYVRIQEGPDRYVNVARPYGIEGPAFFGIGGVVQYDTRDEPANAQEGALVRLSATQCPATHGLAGTFGKSQCDLRAYMGGKGTPALTLALRVLGEKVWGEVPYFELANLGGWNGLRGYTSGRYIGDALALGTVELRASLLRSEFLVPLTLGASCFCETGRVFQRGETSRRWHASYGAAVWVAPWSRDNTMSFILAGSKEGVEMYFDFGVGF